MCKSVRARTVFECVFQNFLKSRVTSFIHTKSSEKRSAYLDINFHPGVEVQYGCVRSERLPFWHYTGIKRPEKSEANCHQ